MGILKFWDNLMQPIRERQERAAQFKKKKMEERVAKYKKMGVITSNKPPHEALVNKWLPLTDHYGETFIKYGLARNKKYCIKKCTPDLETFTIEAECPKTGQTKLFDIPFWHFKQ